MQVCIDDTERGMRISKTAAGSASSQNSMLYRYDGQMGIEDVEKNSSGTITAISRMALGTRGIDAISRTTSSGTSVAYPLYDAHGNNIGLLSKSGSSWSISDERTFDVWGQVRSGGTTGDQKGRYCANLGHNQDDESSLIYMRARYYEPTSGRFISEDKRGEGINWFTYCSNNPITNGDLDGHSSQEIGQLLLVLQNILVVIANNGNLAIGGTVTAAEIIERLEQIQKELQKLGKFRVLWANSKFIEGEGETESAQYQNGLAGLQAYLGRATQSIGAFGYGDKFAAIAGWWGAEVMKELAKQLLD